MTSRLLDGVTARMGKHEVENKGGVVVVVWLRPRVLASEWERVEGLRDV